MRVLLSFFCFFILQDNGFGHDESGLNGAFPSWDNQSVYSGPDNDDYAHSDTDEQDILISQPRQVCVDLFFQFLCHFNEYLWATPLIISRNKHVQMIAFDYYL